MNYTTIEQSKKLLELGLNPETADMWWTPLNWQLTEYYVEVKQDGIGTPKNQIPCWSLGALLEVIPSRVNVEGHAHPLDVSMTWVWGQNRKIYIICYDELEYQSEGRTAVEASCNMIVWLLENGYIKKGK